MLWVGESDIRSRLWLKELHLKYLCAPCCFLLCNDVLTVYDIYLLFFSDPHQRIYYVLRSWVFSVVFFNASKILFYILTYTACLVFKGVFANKHEEKYWCIWAAEFLEGHWIFSVASSMYSNWALINCFSPKITGKVYS